MIIGDANCNSDNTLKCPLLLYKLCREASIVHARICYSRVIVKSEENDQRS